MLGIFDLKMFGRFVVSGDTPEDFLWDLFDQMVFDGNTVTQLAGATIAIPNNSQFFNDADERRRFRGTDAWRDMHSAYFLDIIADGASLIRTDFPLEMFYKLHLARVVGLVLNRTYSSFQHMEYNSYCLTKYGVRTPEYEAAMANEPSQDYPYDTVDPINVLNFIRLRGVLKLQPIGLEAFPELMTNEAVEAAIAEKKAERERIKSEHTALLMSRIKPRKPRRKAGT